MHHSLFTFALALIYSLGVSAEPIAVRGRGHIGRDNALSTSQNTTSRLEKRFSGCRFTWYDTGLGACGKVNQAYESVVALNADQWAGGAHCGKSITISFGGKSKTATIVDLCPGCGGCALDLSESLFQYFADTGVGVLSGSWDFGSSGSGGSSPQQRPVTTSTQRPRPSTTTTQQPTPSTVQQRVSPQQSTTTTTTSSTTRRQTTSTTSNTIPTTSSAAPVRAIPTSSESLPTTSTSSATPLPSNLPGGTEVTNLINLAILSLGKLIVSAAAENNLTTLSLGELIVSAAENNTLNA